MALTKALIQRHAGKAGYAVALLDVAQDHALYLLQSVQLLDRPGIVRVFCDIHSHMSAFILVFSHRFFAVTDDEGRYRIEDVPPGTYTVVVWNERLPQASKPVTIPAAGGTVTLDFSLRASRP